MSAPASGLYDVSIRKDGRLQWWWHVVGTRHYGHAFTERRARRKAAKAILEWETAKRQPGNVLETWRKSDAERVMRDE